MAGEINGNHNDYSADNAPNTSANLQDKSAGYTCDKKRPTDACISSHSQMHVNTSAHKCMHACTPTTNTSINVDGLVEKSRRMTV